MHFHIIYPFISLPPTFSPSLFLSLSLSLFSRSPPSQHIILELLQSWDGACDHFLGGCVVIFPLRATVIPGVQKASADPTIL